MSEDKPKVRDVDVLAAEWASIEPVLVEAANSMLRLAKVAFEAGFRKGLAYGVKGNE